MTAPAFAAHYAELSRSLTASDWPSARSALDAMLTLRPSEPTLKFTQGSVLRNVARTSAEKSRTPGLLAAAHAQYAGALALQPDYAEAAAELASLGDELVRHSLLAAAEAEALHRRAAALGPATAAAWLRLGEWLHTADDGQHERIAEAAHAFGAALRLEPGASGAALRLGTQQHRRGKWSAATKAYARCIELDPANGEAYRLLGTLHAQRDATLVIAEATLRGALEVQGGGGGGGGSAVELSHVLQLQGRLAEAAAVAAAPAAWP